ARILCPRGSRLQTRGGDARELVPSPPGAGRSRVPAHAFRARCVRRGAWRGTCRGSVSDAQDRVGKLALVPAHSPLARENQRPAAPADDGAAVRNGAARAGTRSEPQGEAGRSLSLELPGLKASAGGEFGVVRTRGGGGEAGGPRRPD